MILLVELILVLGSWVVVPDAKLFAGAPTPLATETTNTHALGNILYTDFVYLFQGAGMILLVAMIGAIVLTLRSREGVRRQNISRQVGRTRKEAVELKKVQSGQGI